MKKFIALCLLVTMLTGCSSVPVLSNSVKETSPNEAVVLNVNGRDISASEIYVYIYLMQASAEEEEQLLDNVQEQVLEMEILSQRAQEAGISLDEAEKNSADELADRAFDSMGSIAEEYGITQTLVRDVFEKSQLAGNYYDVITDSYGLTVSDEELASEQGMAIQQLFIAFDDTSHLEDGQTAEELASSVRDRAKAGEDFKTLAKYYSSTDSQWMMDLDSEGCLFDSDGKLESDFTAAVWQLNVGDISDVIHSSYGYHVVKCVDIDSAFLKEKLSGHILEKKQRQRFEEDYTVWQQDAVYTRENAWKKLRVLDRISEISQSRD